MFKISFSSNNCPSVSCSFSTFIICFFIPHVVWVFGDHSMGIGLFTCVRGLCLSLWLSLLPPPLTLFSSIPQVLGQLHGRCARWIHERQPSQWHAHHYSSQEVHGTDTHHLSPGQTAQTGLPPSHGRGRGVGQPSGGGRTVWGSVPRVGGIKISMLIVEVSNRARDWLRWFFVILCDIIFDVFPISDLLS